MTSRFLGSLVCAFALAASLAADDGQRLLTIDHYVRVQSTVPAIAGQPAQIYVRERVQVGTALRAGGAPADRVVLFGHGAGTPSEVAFDVPHQDYSWMAFLANAGFDVFGMDTTGYGRSTRPAAMNDPCNLAKDRQAGFTAPCAPSYPHALTTIASDWDDIDAVVDHIRALRHVDKVSLIAWSLGGPRAGGYTARHPEKVDKLVLLAPAYNRNAQANPPAKMPPDGVPFNTPSRDEFYANWERQGGCADQYDRATGDVVWSEMLASDPVGATWGPGVRRAPATATWGWTQAAVAKTMTPTLLVRSEEHTSE